MTKNLKFNPHLNIESIVNKNFNNKIDDIIKLLEICLVHRPYKENIVIETESIISTIETLMFKI